MRPINRRDMLSRAYTLGSMAFAPPPCDARPRQWKVIVSGGHPGDPEYGCGGTIARFTDAGPADTLAEAPRGGR